MSESSDQYLYVTEFGKTYIVDTSDFGDLEIYKNHIGNGSYTDMKLSGMVKK